MALKHQSNCYRNINGIKYTNHCDLLDSDEVNAKIIADAKEEFKYVKVIKHHTGEYYQLFVAN